MSFLDYFLNFDKTLMGIGETGVGEMEVSKTGPSHVYIYRYVYHRMPFLDYFLNFDKS